MSQASRSSGLTRRNKAAAAANRRPGPRLHLDDEDSDSSVDSDMERLAAESVDKRRQQLIDQKVKEAQEQAAAIAEASLIAAVDEARAEGKRQLDEQVAQHEEQTALLTRVLRQAEARAETVAASLRKVEAQATELEKSRQQLADQLLDLRQEKKQGDGETAEKLAAFDEEKAAVAAQLASKRSECDALIPQLAQQTLRADAAEEKVRQLEADRDELESGILRVRWHRRYCNACV